MIAPRNLAKVPRDQIPAVVAALVALLVESEDEQPEEKWLTADQVADLLQVDRKWVYRNKEKLGAVSLSRRALRFPSSGVERYLRRRKTASGRR
jgi:predicted DNA-binding transcriptional regulator AlpA